MHLSSSLIQAQTFILVIDIVECLNEFILLVLDYTSTFKHVE